MNDYNSGVPAPYTENNVTCISCGRQFPFSKTVEGRCMRDHAVFLDNERRMLMAQVAAGRSGGNSGPIVVQGPTINMTNQQSTNVTAIANAGGYGYGSRPGCFRRLRKRIFWSLMLLAVLFGAGYGITIAVRSAAAAKGPAGPTTLFSQPRTTIGATTTGAASTTTVPFWQHTTTNRHR
jgi:hypothetical protein